MASEQKKQKFRPANIPCSISSSTNRRIFLKKKERTSCFQVKKCVVPDGVCLASVRIYMPKMVSNYRRCRKCSRKRQEKSTHCMCAEWCVPCALRHASHRFMPNNYH
ncbi:hypothetical protein TNCV_1029601 [Trichonephila clavipes]|nr:hypothetical protein TNCV_1029601 [Trichonephila clavipes]